jgi:flavin-binding protein dodecin
MTESVYKVIEVVGSSTESWEKAANLAMTTAARTLRDIRVGEVVSMDLHLDGETLVYRTKLKVSFKYHDEE